VRVEAEVYELEGLFRRGGLARYFWHTLGSRVASAYACYRARGAEAQACVLSDAIDAWRAEAPWARRLAASGTVDAFLEFASRTRLADRSREGLNARFEAALAAEPVRGSRAS
jgi:hypothetical protein